MSRFNEPRWRRNRTYALSNYPKLTLRHKLASAVTYLAFGFIALVIIMALSACAVMKPYTTVVEVPSLTPTAVFQLGNAYGVAQGAAIAYAELPLCADGKQFTSTVWCSDHRVVQQIAGYDAEFVRQFGKLQLWASDPSTLDGLNLLETYAAATSALTGMQAILAQYRGPTL